MSETDSTSPAPIPQEVAKEIRRITHDINNALEIIVQASYLVNTTALTGQAKDWMKLLDQGIKQATDLNRQMREYVLQRSE